MKGKTAFQGLVDVIGAAIGVIHRTYDMQAVRQQEGVAGILKGNRHAMGYTGLVDVVSVRNGEEEFTQDRRNFASIDFVDDENEVFLVESWLDIELAANLGANSPRRIAREDFITIDVLKQPRARVRALFRYFLQKARS